MIRWDFKNYTSGYLAICEFYNPFDTLWLRIFIFECFIIKYSGIYIKKKHSQNQKVKNCVINWTTINVRLQLTVVDDRTVEIKLRMHYFHRSVGHLRLKLQIYSFRTIQIEPNFIKIAMTIWREWETAESWQLYTYIHIYARGNNVFPVNWRNFVGWRQVAGRGGIYTGNADHGLISKWSIIAIPVFFNHFSTVSSVVFPPSMYVRVFRVCTRTGESLPWLFGRGNIRDFHAADHRAQYSRRRASLARATTFRN